MLQALSPWIIILDYSAKLYAVYGALLAMTTLTWYTIRRTLGAALATLRSIAIYWSKLGRVERAGWILAILSSGRRAAWAHLRAPGLPGKTQSCVSSDEHDDDAANVFLQSMMVG